jgi:hypothetical protein
MSQNISTAVMQRRVEADDSLDDFPTPPWSTRAVIEHIVLPLIGPEEIKLIAVREPACNRGYMAKPLAEYFGDVIATDIFDYGYERQRPTSDYLFGPHQYAAEWTFTNPPFRLAEQFIKWSFETPLWRGTAVIVRSAFLEGSNRFEKLFSVRPPAIVAQHVERVIMTKGIVRDPSKEYWDPVTNKWRRPSTATSYSWLIWLRDAPHAGTRMMWIPPCRKAMERPGDYPEVVMERG